MTKTTRRLVSSLTRWRPGVVLRLGPISSVQCVRRPARRVLNCVGSAAPPSNHDDAAGLSMMMATRPVDVTMGEFLFTCVSDLFDTDDEVKGDPGEFVVGIELHVVSCDLRDPHGHCVSLFGFHADGHSDFGFEIAGQF